MFLRAQRYLLSFLLLTLLLSQVAVGQGNIRIEGRYLQPATQIRNVGLSTVATPTGSRTIKFVNSCPYAVWLGAIGGDAARACTKDSDCGAGNVCATAGTRRFCTCSTDADCGVSRACAGNTNPKKCFWVMPPPTAGTWMLLPKMGSFFTMFSTATFSFPDTGVGQRWNGKVFPRTGCGPTRDKGFVCDTGSCVDSNGRFQALCNDVTKAGLVGAGPYTLIEFDLENSSAGVNYDTYDVGLIHGMNVPADIKPDPAGTYPDGTGEDKAYWCTTAAGNPASTGLTACTYKFTPGAMNYLMVTDPGPSGGTLCATDTQCTVPGQKCGLAMQSLMPPMTTKNWGKLTCGKPVAWWSPAAICGNNPSFGLPNTTLFNCTQKVDPKYASYGTVGNMYLCAGGGTCYNKGAPDTCCGCKKWGYPAYPDCYNFNTAWGNEVAPKIQFIKDACPTAYSYQYDDKTSTFTCSNTSKPNTASYIVTFCPGGNTGLPTTSTPY